MKTSTDILHTRPAYARALAAIAATKLASQASASAPTAAATQTVTSFSSAPAPHSDPMPPTTTTINSSKDSPASRPQLPAQPDWKDIESELAAANAAHLAFEHSVLEGVGSGDVMGTNSLNSLNSYPVVEPCELAWADSTTVDAANSLNSLNSYSSASSSGGVSKEPEFPDAALYGPVGEIVRRILPNTEADPAAIYAQVLAGLGNLIGASPYFVADGARHRANLFVIICGRTSKARKGTSWAQAKNILEEVDSEWLANRVKTGTVSGEGIAQVFGDDGDKRLLLLEGEFSQVLQVMRREGNTVSAMLRQAWDGQKIAVLRRKDPIEVEGAHISLAGHITLLELQRLLASVEVGNGMANRCLWVYVDRSKLLPEGGSIPQVDDLVDRLSSAVRTARSRGEVRRDEAARARWREIYEQLSEPPAGQLGDILSRAEAQVMRLALLLALLDESEFIGLPHLEAALLFWQYCHASAAYIFAETFASPKALKIWEALARGPLTRSQISALFGGNVSKEAIDAAIAELGSRVMIEGGKGKVITLRRKT